MARIRGVVLDKDGTMFGFQETWGAWSRTLIAAESRGDAAVAARLARALGYDLARGEFEPGSIVVASTTEEVARAILPLLPPTTPPTTLPALVARMDALAAGAPQAEAAPLDAVLGRLRAMGLALGVATNDSEAPARAHLAGVMRHLDFVAGYDSGWGGKPAPGQLLAFAQAVGLAPAECAMVGDSLHDLHAARAAGMRAVAVLRGLATRADLGPAADVVLGSIADLPDWIAAQG